MQDLADALAPATCVPCGISEEGVPYVAYNPACANLQLHDVCADVAGADMHCVPEAGIAFTALCARDAKIFRTCESAGRARAVLWWIFTAVPWNDARCAQAACDVLASWRTSNATARNISAAALLDMVPQTTASSGRVLADEDHKDDAIDETGPEKGGATAACHDEPACDATETVERSTAAVVPDISLSAPSALAAQPRLLITAALLLNVWDSRRKPGGCTKDGSFGSKQTLHTQRASSDTATAGRHLQHLLMSPSVSIAKRMAHAGVTSTSMRTPSKRKGYSFADGDTAAGLGTRDGPSLKALFTPPTLASLFTALKTAHRKLWRIVQGDVVGVLTPDTLADVLGPLVDMLGFDATDIASYGDLRTKALDVLATHGVNFSHEALSTTRTAVLLVWGWVLDELHAQRTPGTTRADDGHDSDARGGLGSATVADAGGFLRSEGVGIMLHEARVAEHACSAYDVCVHVCRMFPMDILALWSALAYTMPTGAVAQCLWTTMCVDKVPHVRDMENDAAPWLVSTMNASPADTRILQTTTLALELLWHFRNREGFIALCDLHRVLHTIVAVRHMPVSYTLVHTSSICNPVTEADASVTTVDKAEACTARREGNIVPLRNGGMSVGIAKRVFPIGVARSEVDRDEDDLTYQPIPIAAVARVTTKLRDFAGATEGGRRSKSNRFTVDGRCEAKPRGAYDPDEEANYSC